MASPCPLPLNCTLTYGRLTVDGWALQGPAWCVYDLSEMYVSPNVQGSNWEVEDRPGAIAQPVLVAEGTHQLPVAFSGAVDRTGVPWPNPAGGLLANRVAFESHFIRPIRGGTASLPALLEMPDPFDAEGWLEFPLDVQPLRLTWRLDPEAYAHGVLTLRVPEGGVMADVGEGEGE